MKRGMLLIALLGTLVLTVFTGPALWAAPGQDPYRQTVATVIAKTRTPRASLLRIRMIISS